MHCLCCLCNQPLSISKIERRNHSYTAKCSVCDVSASVKIDETTNQPIVSNIQKRFAYNGMTWHLTYRPSTDQSTFVKIGKGLKPIYINGIKIDPVDDRIKNVLPGFVSAERFINLLSFL